MGHGQNITDLESSKEVWKMEQYYFRCGENASETKSMIEDEIEQWLTSRELGQIVETFGGRIPRKKNTVDLAKWLLDFSDIWDYRRKQREAKDSGTGEAARWLINNDVVSAKQESIVLNNSEKLGLKGIAEPFLRQYDYIIALGGARMSCLFRPQWVWELIQRKGYSPRAAVMLSGMRPVSDSERAATDTYAPGAATEFDLINAGAEKVFGLETEYTEERYHSSNQNNSWAIRRYETSKYSFPILSVSGPSSQPEIRRANSADTFRFFAERQQIPSESRVMLVTSQIYVPYQQLEAIRTWAIPNNVYIETVGFPAEWNDTKQQGMMTAANYLQEIRSTIQAANRYLDSVK